MLNLSHFTSTLDFQSQSLTWRDLHRFCFMCSWCKMVKRAILYAALLSAYLLLLPYNIDIGQNYCLLCRILLCTPFPLQTHTHTHVDTQRETHTHCWRH